MSVLFLCNESFTDVLCFTSLKLGPTDTAATFLILLKHPHQCVVQECFKKKKALIIGVLEMKFMSTVIFAVMLLEDFLQGVVCALEAITESGIGKTGVRQHHVTRRWLVTLRV